MIPGLSHTTRYIRMRAGKHAQALLNIIAQDLEKFDSVCMATSIHTLANLRCTKAQYQAVFESPEMLRLMAAVCESLLQMPGT